jgi:hypothetical protein
MSKIINFYLQGNEPYLTKMEGLTKLQLDTFAKKGYPLIINNTEGVILTTMTNFFSEEIKKTLGLDVLLYKHQLLADQSKFQINLVTTKTDFVEFCIGSPLPDVYFQLLRMKVKMQKHPDFGCLLFNKKYVNFLKQEKTYIDFNESESRAENEKRSINEEPSVRSKKEKLEPAPSIQNLNDLSSYFGDRKDYVQFRGRYVWEWGWLLFLEKELGAKIVCIWKGTSGDGGMFFDNTNGFLVKEWVVKELNRCLSQTKSRFTVGILEVKLDTGVYHANALIFDSENKILTRFEPHGSGLEVKYDVGMLDTQINKWMTQNIKGWTYRAPIHFCPSRGPQTLETELYYNSKMKAIYGDNLNKEAGGFCSAWSLLFLHYRLVNPELSEKEIVDYMVSQSGEILFNRIREYVGFIVKNVDPNWTTDEKRLLLSVDDNVQFKKSRDKIEYGRIIVMDKENATVFSINNLMDKSASGDVLDYKIYNVKLAQLSLIDDSESMIDTITKKVKQYAAVIKKMKQQKK